MKIYVVVGFILACILSGLNAACTGRKDCPVVKYPAESPMKIEYVYEEGEACDCSKKHKFTVETPKVPPTVKPCGKEVGYEVEIPSVKSDLVKRYRYDARIDQPATEKPSSVKPCDYAFDIKVPPKVEESMIRYRYDSKIEAPSLPTCDQPKLEGLRAQVDKIVAPKKGECRCRQKDHSAECSCGATNKVPINYNRRYDSNSLFNDIYTDLSELLDENARENSLSPLRREKRAPSKKPKKVKKIKKTRKSRKPKKSLKKKRIRSRELSKFNRIPGAVRRKRIPASESPCAYSFKSCDVNNPNVKGKSCPLCYQCKCEPTSMDKQAPIKIGVPYRVAPKHHELHESHERHESSKGDKDRVRQQFQSAPASYVGLPPDMYKKYIGQILSKYPEYMHNKMPDYQEQQQDLMKFVGELAQSRIQQEHERPYARSQKSEDVKYKLIDDAVNLYELYENSQAKKQPADSKSVTTKSNNKRGTILEVIELDSDEIQSFEHLLEKDFA